MAYSEFDQFLEAMKAKFGRQSHKNGSLRVAIETLPFHSIGETKWSAVKMTIFRTIAPKYLATAAYGMKNWSFRKRFEYSSNKENSTQESTRRNDHKKRRTDIYDVLSLSLPRFRLFIIYERRLLLICSFHHCRPFSLLTSSPAFTYQHPINITRITPTSSVAICH